MTAHSAITEQKKTLVNSSCDRLSVLPKDCLLVFIREVVVGWGSKYAINIQKYIYTKNYISKKLYLEIFCFVLLVLLLLADRDERWVV